MWTEPLAVIAAHPDDEVLGFGGAIARAANAGADVRVLILATGAASRGGDAQAAIETLRGQARRAAEALGVAAPSFADFPDNRMDTVPLLDVVQRIEAFLGEVQPQSVFTHHAGDLNVDHRIAAQAVLTACRPLPGMTVRRVLAGEVPSSSEWASEPDRFVPTRYVDITAVLERKLSALACYDEELRDFPHPRSLDAVRALATWRGAEAGLRAAEAYRVIREIDD